MEVRPREKDLKGWLKRKGGRIPTWSRRWFILTDKFLFMYLKDEDEKSKDCITLNGQLIVEPSPDPTETKKGYFDIVTESNNGQVETVNLCADSEEEKNIWVRALKRALYADKGGALFSQSLQEILFWERQFGRRIPYIVDECVEFLYKYGLDVEGIFRLPGRQSAMKDIISRFERGDKVRFEDDGVDVHVVASVLKTFLRELPDSIIPCQHFQKFMHIAMRFMESAESEVKDECIDELSQSMKLLPEDNYIILKYICHFLREVGLHESNNKMTFMSLGTIFGYNIIRHIDKENSQLFLCTADLSQHLVFMLLNFYPRVFTLEYSDRGEAAQNVPTADLLRMSRILNIPAAIPQPAMSNHLADIEDLNMSSVSISTDKKHSSIPYHTAVILQNPVEEIAIGVKDGNGNKKIAIPFDSAQEKRDLHLSSSHSDVEISDSNSRMPEAPPRRTKSKIMRNRNVSDRRRPEGFIVHPDSDVTPKSPVSPVGVNTEDVLTALAQANIVNKSLHVASASSAMTSHHFNTTASSLNPLCYSNTSISSMKREIVGDGKLDTSAAELSLQVAALKEELALQKEHFKQQLLALKTQLSDVKEKYEKRITTMETQFHSQKLELQNKLSSEMEACAAAVANVVKLKEDLHRYQTKFGEPPS